MVEIREELALGSAEGEAEGGWPLIGQGSWL